MIKKEKSKELIKPLTKREVQKRYNDANNYQWHPSYIYQELSKKLPILTDDEKENKEKDLIDKWWYLNSFEKSHIFIAECFRWNIQFWAIELINNLIEEYNCNTSLEKTLCEMIALNYWKILELTKKYNSVMLAWNTLTNERTKYLNMLSKELDRVNRVYLISLNNLIDIKKPKINLNIKTKNAFISNNQQFNNNLNKNDEIIKD